MNMYFGNFFRRQLDNADEKKHKSTMVKNRMKAKKEGIKE